MNDSKLIGLLNTFSPEEITEFRKFVRSPFFNRLNKVSQLYDVLKKHYPLFNNSRLKKQNIFRKLYPGEEYNDDKLRNLSSDLFNLALKYLTEISLKRNNLNKNISLLNELILRDQPKVFEKILSRTKMILEEVKVEDENLFLKKFEMENVLTLYYQLYQNDVREIENSQKKIAENLINFFTVSIFKTYSWMLNQQRTLYKHENQDLSLLNELLMHIRTNGKRYQKFLYIDLYSSIINLLIKNDMSYYYRINEILNKNIKNIDKLALKNLYIMLGNYCQNEIYNGNKRFEFEIFELDKDMYKNKIHKAELIRYSSYRNFVIHALNVNEYEWAEKFLNEYKNQLPKELRKSAFNCGCALICLWKKEYDKAFEHLANASTEELSFKLDIKSITAMIYYEQNHVESLISLIDSYKHLLSNSRVLSDKFKPFYTNYVKFIEKLLKAKLKPESVSLKNLEREIISEGSFYKSWLMQKVNELFNR